MFDNMRMHGMEYFEVKLTCSRHESTEGIRGLERSGHLNAPGTLTRVLVEQKTWWVSNRSKCCGSRISISVCPTRSPVTASAELQNLLQNGRKMNLGI